MELIGTVGRIEVRVDERAVVVSWPAGVMGGMGLVNLLAGKGGDVGLSESGGWMTAMVVHTDAVERRVAELVAVLGVLQARMGWEQLGMDSVLQGVL